jgi:hypothetical protein
VPAHLKTGEEGAGDDVLVAARAGAAIDSHLLFLPWEWRVRPEDTLQVRAVHRRRVVLISIE